VPIAVLDVPCLHRADGAEVLSKDLLDWVNGVLREFVAIHPDRATLIPVTPLVCPDGNPDQYLAGAPLRPDGRHYDEGSARALWQWIKPELLKASS